VVSVLGGMYIVGITSSSEVCCRGFTQTGVGSGYYCYFPIQSLPALTEDRRENGFPKRADTAPSHAELWYVMRFHSQDQYITQ